MPVDVAAMLKRLRIDARRNGDEWWAACPSRGHNEREPSWSINDGGGHYCFGCHWQGSPIELVMEIVGFRSRRMAHEWITENGLRTEQAPPLNARLVVRDPERKGVFELPDERRHEGKFGFWATPPRRYVLGRGITIPQAERWRLSYCVDGEFAGRIVFPFYGPDGVPRSLSARTFTGHEKRYKAPRLEAHPDLGSLFGELHWPPAAERRDASLVLTEGAIDALACERAGARCIGAFNGSKLHRGAALRLSRFGEVVIATDNDKAGKRIAAELRPLARWTAVRRVKMPKGEDAASLETGRLAEILGCLGVGQR